VLVSAFKVGERASVFNFEAVHTKYKNYMKNHNSTDNQTISKQTFLKIFLDLCDKGFLRSENETDILSINNKIALGFRARDLEEIILSRIDQLKLPDAVRSWVKMA